MLEVFVASNAVAFSAGSAFLIQRFFGFLVFEDRFDEQSRQLAIAGAIDVGFQSVGDGFDAVRRFQTFLEKVLRTIKRGLDVFHLTILQRDVETAIRAPRGDITAHHTRTDDMHMFDVQRSAPAPSPFRRSCKKYTRMRFFAVGGLREFRNGSRFELQPLRDARSAASPHFDQREWRGILIGARFSRRLLAHDRRENLPDRPDIRRPRAQTLYERSSVRMTNLFFRRFDEQLGRCQNIDDAERFRLLGADRFSRSTSIAMPAARR